MSTEYTGRAIDLVMELYREVYPGVQNPDLEPPSGIPFVRYVSIFVGEKWPLSDADWKALQDNGWKVRWATFVEQYGTSHERSFINDGRYVGGALAMDAYLPYADLDQALSAFDTSVSRASGAPGRKIDRHVFTAYNAGGEVIDRIQF